MLTRGGAVIEKIKASNLSESNNTQTDRNDPKTENTKVTENGGTDPTVNKEKLTENKENQSKGLKNTTVNESDPPTNNLPIKKTNVPTGNKADKIVPKPICTSTQEQFRTQLTSSNLCAPLFEKQEKCCVIKKEELIPKLNRPQTIQGILDMLDQKYDQKKRIEEFLVKHDYNVSRRNNIVDPNIWNELQEELPDIANFLMYGIGCDVPLESIQDIYRDKLTDNSVCFVDFIIKSIKKLDTVYGPIKLVEEITKTFDLKYICDIIYNEETIPFRYENSKKHLLVYNGLKNTIPKECDVYHTLYLCIGLVLNRHAKPSTQSNKNIAICFGYEGTLIPYQISEQSIMLLFKYIKYFPQLCITPHNKETNSLLSFQNIQASTDRTKSISIVHTGMRIESPVHKIPHISLERLIKVPDELTLRNCNIGDAEIAIILTHIQERSHQKRSLKILDVGNNPIRRLPKNQNGHILNYLAMDLCSIDTNAAAVCLHVCKGVVNVSGNKNVQWANLNNTVNINATELIIFDCGTVNISNAFKNIEKLYFSNGIVSGLSNLKLLACSMDTMTNDQKNKIFELSTTTLTDLIIGGTSKTGTQFNSSLDRKTSSKLEKIMKNNCILEVMCLSHCNISNIDSIITNTKHLDRLKELYIANMNLHGEVIGSALAVLLSKNTLKVLGINNNGFCNKSISNIGVGLRNNQSLARLHMSNVPIYDSTLEMFEQIKDVRHQLEVLELGGDDLRSQKDNRFFPLLLGYISNFTNINMLKCSNLIQNDYDDKLAKSLGSLMKKCKNMRYLDLSNCNLNLVCLSTLFINLPESQITQLLVNNNKISSNDDNSLISDIIKSLNNNNTELACLSINKVFSNEMETRFVNYINLKYPHVIVHA